MEPPSTTQRAVFDPFSCPSLASQGRRRPLRGLSSPSNRRGGRCSPLRCSGARSPLSSTGNLLLAPSPSATYESKQGISDRERKKRLDVLFKEPASMTKWQKNGRKGWNDVGEEVSEQLEYAWVKGLPKCGVWENGRFREYDLNNMKEIPGHDKLRRVRDEPEQSNVAKLMSRPSTSFY
mmetsp:Transcript_58096/g.101700  ORF Transcript_58096/g.101700 Transcript_58096/m.101700 type:complete len:179 (+) Transcript_58096:50-586(+)